MSDARERLVKAVNAARHIRSPLHSPGGIVAPLPWVADAWAVIAEVQEVGPALLAERDALRSELDEAVALLRQYPESVRALDSASHRRWRRDRHAFLARIEGSDK